MKVLTKYALKEHITPFLFAFFVTTFVLILETLPRLVSLVIDKSVSIWIVLELIGLNLAWMLALSTPMSILVATISAFGRLGSDSEMMAMKASGVNPVRILVPVVLASIAIAGIMIHFNDQILPGLNHKARVLMGDIRVMRPTLIFTPGRFVDDIRGYLILLDRVDHKTSEVGGVRINDIRNPQNPVMILAERGLMEFIDGGNTIKFTLYDGEINELNMKDPSAYKRITFGKQIFYVTGVGSELVRSESGHKTDREMNIAEMEDYISKVKMSMNPFRQRATTLISTEFESLFDDSVSTSYAEDTTYINMTDTMALIAFRDRVNSVERRVERTISQIKEQEKLVARYQIEINKKYSIPFAGVVFVLFGAPLAIMTRRGGMGFSIAVSLGIFVLYWASLIAGEDLADRGLIDPYWAMWGANVFVGIIGLFLIYLMYTERPITTLLRKRSETTL